MSVLLALDGSRQRIQDYSAGAVAGDAALAHEVTRCLACLSQEPAIRTAGTSIALNHSVVTTLRQADGDSGHNSIAGRKLRQFLPETGRGMS